MAKSDIFHTSLRISKEQHLAVLRYCEQHIITNISDGLRRLLDEALGRQPRELIVLNGVANQEQLESFLGALTDWVNVLRDVKNSLRKTLPAASDDPALHAQVQLWRAKSADLLTQVEALRTRAVMVGALLAGIQPELVVNLRVLRAELVAQAEMLEATAANNPEAKEQIAVWRTGARWLEAAGI